MAEYSLQPLPLSADGGGNFATRNARFRNMVCLHYGLKWISVGSNGNCFFESFVLLLHSSWPGLNAGLLRQNVVELFRTCLDSTQPLFENIAMEIECEINEELVCSNRKKMDGHRLNGYKPTTPQNYCDAVECDGVWVQGMHWFRAMSYLYDVCIAVIIFGQDDIRFFGSGDTTVYLYKTDSSSHFDPLLPIHEADASLFPAPSVLISSDSSSCESACAELAVVSTPPQVPSRAELAVVSTPSQVPSRAELAVVSTPSQVPSRAELALARLRPRKRPVPHSSSESEATDPPHRAARVSRVGHARVSAPPRPSSSSDDDRPIHVSFAKTCQVLSLFL
jgi:hypothetical protein